MKKYKNIVIMATILLVFLTACGSGSSSQARGSRSNPIPFGASADLDGIKFTVIDTPSLKGLSQSWPLSAKFYPSPESGYSYLVVRLKIECDKDIDESCSVDSYSFGVIGDKGVFYSPLNDSGTFYGLGFLESQKLFGGGVIEGDMVFSVLSNDTSLILTYGVSDDSSVYLSID